ncbi:Putative exported protein [uncultured Candidatus Thioglobus sp.]|nr:Putative exported protein [uncultured Candidatus Thioglobus sp.]
MKKILLLCGLFSIVGSANAEQYFNATIDDIKTIYKEITIKEPYQECYQQDVRVSNDNSPTSEIFGAIVGGAVGNQFGKGHGKDAMTIAGALLGASLGSDHDAQAGGYTTTKDVCETKYRYRTEERIQGYRLILDYKGIKGTKRVQYNNHNIGDTIKVKITIR